MKDEYSFGRVDVFSGKNTKPKMNGLLKQMKQMLKEEKATATKATLAVPDRAPLPKGSVVSAVPRLGEVTLKREQDEKEAEEKLRSMVIVTDDPVLAELDALYLGECFYDEGENRIVRDIEWNEDLQLWEAMTERIKADGSELDEGQQNRAAPYGLLGEDGSRETWLPIFDAMIDDFARRLKQ